MKWYLRGIGVRKIIDEKLKEIETREGVRILHCVESGSRAWGFASPDSDYDVRFIYVRPKDFYLQLNVTRDVIEWQLDDTLDINGWDIKKALQLLYKSNPTLFEWNSSPIIYKTTEAWTEISALIDRFFVAKAGLYHYLSTAKRLRNTYLTSETIKYKRYFYVIRPLLACKWILAEGTPAPMLFKTLMDRYLDEDIKPDVEKLLDLKMNSPELAQGKSFPRVDEYIEKTMAELEEAIKNLPDRHMQSWEVLNEAFLKLLD